MSDAKKGFLVVMGILAALYVGNMILQRLPG